MTDINKHFVGDFLSTKKNQGSPDILLQSVEAAVYQDLLSVQSNTKLSLRDG